MSDERIDEILTAIEALRVKIEALASRVEQDDEFLPDLCRPAPERVVVPTFGPVRS